MINFIPEPEMRCGQRAYEDALAEERSVFESCLAVHELPPIFHYWSNRYIRQKLHAFGFDSPKELFAKQLEDQCRWQRPGIRHFISLGAGNCELELELAHDLRRGGYESFEIECMDLNLSMLARGRAAAEKAGLSSFLRFTVCDLNEWGGSSACDAVIANQSLHHVIKLEQLFENIGRSLASGGVFVIADTIGRNGHQRWPEALAIVHEFWRRLPPSYRFNSRLRRYEELFENWDCSRIGFEGVRAQDILPMLVRTFHFRLFIPFANVIEPFVDRTFGYHFDVSREWDRVFIDEVHHRDEQEIALGKITPTQMMAIVVNEAQGRCRFPSHLSPEFCIRPPSRNLVVSNARLADPYDWFSWPHSTEDELRLACARLADYAQRFASIELEIERRTAWALDLEKQLEDRTAWARQLEQEVEKRTNWARGLERQLEEGAAWARRLEREVEDRTRWARSIEADLEARTTWALSLDRELRERTRELTILRAEIYGYIHRPHRFVARLLAGVWQRAKRAIGLAVARLNVVSAHVSRLYSSLEAAFRDDDTGVNPGVSTDRSSGTRTRREFQAQRSSSDDEAV